MNGAALGLVWTPLLPAAWLAEKGVACGRHGPLQSARLRVAIVPSYVLLASDDASYRAGHILHPNGGMVVNG